METMDAVMFDGHHKEGQADEAETMNAEEAETTAQTSPSVTLVYKCQRHFIQSKHAAILKALIRDPVIHAAWIKNSFSLTTPTWDMDVNPEPPEDSEDNEDNNVLSLEIQADAAEVVKRRTLELGYALEEVYDYKTDTTSPSLKQIHFRPHTKIRSYQAQALASMLGTGAACSGVIVLPCGAGKTLTGITAAHTIQKSVLCLTPNAMAARQWKDQFQQWTHISDQEIVVFTSDQKPKPKTPSSSAAACVLITTYQMIAFHGKRAAESQQMMDYIMGQEWGLLLLDEVHVVPAPEYRRAVQSLKVRCKLGLTATMVREDDLISDLHDLVGPTLYEVNWMDLTHQGYLCPVRCIEAWCPLTDAFQNAYNVEPNARNKMVLCGINPNKLRVVELLVRYHERKGDKIIVFSDNIFVLQTCAEMLKRPYIYGQTKEWERQVVLDLFRKDTLEVQTICLSRVGDVAIDLPKANVVIQVSCQFTSRRAEAQRLGRILRPKSLPGDGDNTRSSLIALFYTLVCTETPEMKFCRERQQYLVEQGYKFEIVKNLWKQANGLAISEGYAFSTPEADHKILEAARNELKKDA